MLTTCAQAIDTVDGAGSHRQTPKKTKDFRAIYQGC